MWGHGRHSGLVQRQHAPQLRRRRRLFARWARREGFSALPAKPETVAAYLAERAAAGLSPASLRVDRAAIRHHHSEAGHANPADNEGVRRVMRGLTRRAVHEGRTPRQAAALTARALEAIRATAHLRRTGPGGRTEGARTARRRGRVDVALISVMRDAMLRRGEAAALTWADVEFRSDGSARVTVRRSKSDQDGNGATLYVGRDAATELRAVHGPDASPGAPVFGLHTGKNRVEADRQGGQGRRAGRPLLGALAARIGMARDLVASGAGVAAVQVAGRWASPQMPSYYARAELAGDGAVARFYGEE